MNCGRVFLHRLSPLVVAPWPLSLVAGEWCAFRDAGIVCGGQILDAPTPHTRLADLLTAPRPCNKTQARGYLEKHNTCSNKLGSNS